VAMLGCQRRIGLLLVTTGAMVWGQGSGGERRVDRSELLAAMRLQRGYDVTATPNGARFKAMVMLELARWARERDPEGSLLTIGHEDMFHAYLELTGLSAERAPVFVRLPYQHRQDYQLDSHRARVIKTVVKGPHPDLALNVKEWWPDSPDLPDKYSYVDEKSTPTLAMTCRRVVTYRLLQFGDMVVHDEIRGLSGRPTSGPLGFLTRFLGEASASRSKSMVTTGGVVVTRAEVKKVFPFARNVTIYPDGRTEDGLRTTLANVSSLKAQLEQEIRIDYVPFGRP